MTGCNRCKTASLYLPIGQLVTPVKIREGPKQMCVGTWCDVGDDPVQSDQVKYVGMLMRQDVSVRG
jgi:hypothetical protein